MGDMRIEGLYIEVENNSTIQANGVHDFASAICELKIALKGSFANLHKIAEYLREVGDAMTTLPSSNIIEKYTDFFKSFKGVGNLGKRAISNIGDLMTKFNGYTKVMNNNIVPSGVNWQWGAMFDEYEHSSNSYIYDSFNRIVKEKSNWIRAHSLNKGKNLFLGEGRQYFNDWVDKDGYGLVPVGNAYEVERDGKVTTENGFFANLKKSMFDFKQNFSTKIMPEIISRFQSFGGVKGIAIKGIKNIGKKVGTLFKQIRRIALYRLIRRALQLITQGITEGINRMYQYSSVYNNTFKKAMDSISTSTNYLKSALGTAIAPLIEIIEPFFTKLVDNVANASNELGRFFAILSGDKFYTKAIKNQTKYTNGLKTQMLGIDELHKSSNTSDYEYAEKSVGTLNSFQSNMLIFIKRIKELFGAIKDILLSPAIKMLKRIFTIVFAIFSTVMNIVIGAVDLFNTIFNIEGQVSSIADIIDCIGSAIEGVITWANKQIYYAYEVCKDIADLFNKLFSGDFKGLGESLDKLGSDYVSSLRAMFGMDTSTFGITKERTSGSGMSFGNEENAKTYIFTIDGRELVDSTYTVNELLELLKG